MSKMRSTFEEVEYGFMTRMATLRDAVREVAEAHGHIVYEYPYPHSQLVEEWKCRLCGCVGYVDTHVIREGVETVDLRSPCSGRDRE
jgi:hypothetical protein